MSRSRKKKERVQVGKMKNSRQSFLSLSLLGQKQSRRTHRTTRDFVDALLPARRGEESDKGRGVEEQQRRAASDDDDDDDVDAAVFLFSKIWVWRKRFKRISFGHEHRRCSVRNIATKKESARARERDSQRR